MDLMTNKKTYILAQSFSRNPPYFSVHKLVGLDCDKLQKAIHHANPNLNFAYHLLFWSSSLSDKLPSYFQNN